MDDILVEYNGELLPETMAGRLEPLFREAHDIQQYLNAPYSGEINVLLDRLSTLNVYMARSGEMLAEAVFLQEEAINRASEENKERIDCMAATVANKYLTSCCRHENRLVKWLDRINATCKHQSDNLRTQISFVKEQVRLDGRGY